MSLDCPVACSHTSSIPEVVGDAAAFFDPTSIDDMRQAMESVLNTSTTSARLVALGRTRAGMFSWQRCAQATAAIYRQTLAP
jgi:glycosyltransferase involved in cell wall biosynthesis